MRARQAEIKDLVRAVVSRRRHPCMEGEAKAAKASVYMIRISPVAQDEERERALGRFADDGDEHWPVDEDKEIGLDWHLSVFLREKHPGEEQFLQKLLADDSCALHGEPIGRAKCCDSSRPGKNFVHFRPDDPDCSVLFDPDWALDVRLCPELYNLYERTFREQLQKLLDSVCAEVERGRVLADQQQPRLGMRRRVEAPEQEKAAWEKNATLQVPGGVKSLQPRGPLPAARDRHARSCSGLHFYAAAKGQPPHQKKKLKRRHLVPADTAALHSSVVAKETALSRLEDLRKATAERLRSLCAEHARALQFFPLWHLVFVLYSKNSSEALRAEAYGFVAGLLTQDVRRAALFSHNLRLDGGLRDGDRQRVDVDRKNYAREQATFYELLRKLVINEGQTPSGFASLSLPKQAQNKKERLFVVEVCLHLLSFAVASQEREGNRSRLDDGVAVLTKRFREASCGSAAHRKMTRRPAIAPPPHGREWEQNSGGLELNRVSVTKSCSASSQEPAAPLSKYARGSIFSQEQQRLLVDLLGERIQLRGLDERDRTRQEADSEIDRQLLAGLMRHALAHVAAAVRRADRRRRDILQEIFTAGENGVLYPDVGARAQDPWRGANLDANPFARLQSEEAEYQKLVQLQSSLALKFDDESATGNLLAFFRRWTAKWRKQVALSKKKRKKAAASALQRLAQDAVVMQGEEFLPGLESEAHQSLTAEPSFSEQQGSPEVGAMLKCILNQPGLLRPRFVRKAKPIREPTSSELEGKAAMRRHRRNLRRDDQQISATPQTTSGAECEAACENNGLEDLEQADESPGVLPLGQRSFALVLRCALDEVLAADFQSLTDGGCCPFQNLKAFAGFINAIVEDAFAPDNGHPYFSDEVRKRTVVHAFERAVEGQIEIGLKERSIAEGYDSEQYRSFVHGVFEVEEVLSLVDFWYLAKKWKEHVDTLSAALTARDLREKEEAEKRRRARAVPSCGDEVEELLIAHDREREEEHLLEALELERIAIEQVEKEKNDLRAWRDRVHECQSSTAQEFFALLQVRAVWRWRVVQRKKKKRGQQESKSAAGAASASSAAELLVQNLHSKVQKKLSAPTPTSDNFYKYGPPLSHVRAELLDRARSARASDSTRPLGEYERAEKLQLIRGWDKEKFTTWHSFCRAWARVETWHYATTQYGEEGQYDAVDLDYDDEEENDHERSDVDERDEAANVEVDLESNIPPRDDVDIEDEDDGNGNKADLREVKRAAYEAINRCGREVWDGYRKVWEENVEDGCAEGARKWRLRVIEAELAARGFDDVVVGESRSAGGERGGPGAQPATVVVAGLGFAGVNVVRELRKGGSDSRLRVVAVDAKPFFEFTPGAIRAMCENCGVASNRPHAAGAEECEDGGPQERQQLQHRPAEEVVPASLAAFLCQPLTTVKRLLNKCRKRYGLTAAGYLTRWHFHADYEELLSTTSRRPQRAGCRGTATSTGGVVDVEFVHGSVIGVDDVEKTVKIRLAAGGTTSTTRTVAFDYAVLSTGTPYDVWKPDSYKPDSGCLAAPADHPQTSRKCFLQAEHAFLQSANRVKIVGGGVVGVELCADLAHYFPHLVEGPRRRGGLTLEVRDRNALLPGFPDYARRYALNYLVAQKGVRVVVAGREESVTPETSGSTCTSLPDDYDKVYRCYPQPRHEQAGPTATTTSSTGNKTCPMPPTFPGAEWRVVGRDLLVAGCASVYAIGDGVDFAEEIDHRPLVQSGAGSFQREQAWVEQMHLTAGQAEDLGRELERIEQKYNAAASSSPNKTGPQHDPHELVLVDDFGTGASASSSGSCRSTVRFLFNVVSGAGGFVRSLLFPSSFTSKRRGRVKHYPRKERARSRQQSRESAPHDPQQGGQEGERVPTTTSRPAPSAAARPHRNRNAYVAETMAKLVARNIRNRLEEDVILRGASDLSFSLRKIYFNNYSEINKDPTVAEHLSNSPGLLVHLRKFIATGCQFLASALAIAFFLLHTAFFLPLHVFRYDPGYIAEWCDRKSGIISQLEDLISPSERWRRSSGRSRGRSTRAAEQLSVSENVFSDLEVVSLGPNDGVVVSGRFVLGTGSLAAVLKNFVHWTKMRELRGAKWDGVLWGFVPHF
eukprot:g5007.t1